MKNIIIWGVPRSGKSTLAYMIRQEFGHSVIQMDAIKRVYDVLRPEDNIYAPETTNYDEARLMANMVTRLIQCMSWGNHRGEFHVYEGVSFNMDIVLPTLQNDMFPISLDNFVVICMGYADISPEEKVKQVAQYETTRDWTLNENLGSKLEHFKKYCDESQFIKRTAERLGLAYFDVSFNRDEVLDGVIEYIRTQDGGSLI